MDPLTRAIVELVDRKQRPPCASKPDLWFAVNVNDRRAARHRCAPCPLLHLCWEAGQGERWGVWGGIDRTEANSPEADDHRHLRRQEAS